MSERENLVATTEHYKDFVESVVWKDILLFCQECISVNRDILEGIRGFQEGFKVESDDALRGRCWQLRDLIAYVNERANPPEEFRDSVAM